MLSVIPLQFQKITKDYGASVSENSDKVFCERGVLVQSENLLILFRRMGKIDRMVSINLKNPFPILRC